MRLSIGENIKRLRRERDITQEQLAEIFNVSCQTISRWENGNYLPPVEMLQELSKLYAVSINELLCGERIEQENYQEKAEETITGILSGSPFSFQERSSFWKRKWQKEHFLGNFVLTVLIFAAFLTGFYYSMVPVVIIAPVTGLFLYMKRHNDMMIYVENNLYGPVK